MKKWIILLSLTLCPMLAQAHGYSGFPFGVTNSIGDWYAITHTYDPLGQLNGSGIEKQQACGSAGGVINQQLWFIHHYTNETGAGYTNHVPVYQGYSTNVPESITTNWEDGYPIVHTNYSGYNFDWWQNTNRWTQTNVQAFDVSGSEYTVTLVRPLTSMLDGVLPAIGALTYYHIGKFVLTNDATFTKFDDWFSRCYTNQHLTIIHTNVTPWLTNGINTNATPWTTNATTLDYPQDFPTASVERIFYNDIGTNLTVILGTDVWGTVYCGDYGWTPVSRLESPMLASATCTNIINTNSIPWTTNAAGWDFFRYDDGYTLLARTVTNPVITYTSTGSIPVVSFTILGIAWEPDNGFMLDVNSYKTNLSETVTISGTNTPLTKAYLMVTNIIGPSSGALAGDSVMVHSVNGVQRYESFGDAHGALDSWMVDYPWRVEKALVWMQCPGTFYSIQEHRSGYSTNSWDECMSIATTNLLSTYTNDYFDYYPPGVQWQGYYVVNIDSNHVTYLHAWQVDAFTTISFPVAKPWNVYDGRLTNSTVAHDVDYYIAFSPPVNYNDLYYSGTNLSFDAQGVSISKTNILYKWETLSGSTQFPATGTVAVGYLGLPNNTPAPAYPDMTTITNYYYLGDPGEYGGEYGTRYFNIGYSVQILPRCVLRFDIGGGWNYY